MLTLILKKYWRHLAILTAAVFVLVSVYSYVYDRGYHASEIACIKKFDAYSKKLDERIANIEVLSFQLNVTAEETTKATTTKLNQILIASKTKPPFIIENGKCTLSKDFIDSYNSLIREGNSK